MPPIRIMVGTKDLLLDDQLLFMKRLVNLDHDCQLYVLKDLRHGFLNMSRRNLDGICEYVNDLVKIIQSLFDMEVDTKETTKRKEEDPED